MRRLALPAILLLLFLLPRCSDDHEVSVIAQPVPLVSQVATAQCCDFDHRDRCQEYQLRLILKPSFQKAHRVCFKHDECLTDCPPGEK